MCLRDQQEDKVLGIAESYSDSFMCGEMSRIVTWMLRVSDIGQAKLMVVGEFHTYNTLNRN